MPLMLYPVCWRERNDCEPIQCIDAAPDDLTEEQLYSFNYRPLSFVCTGCVKKPDPMQDQYRLCFKNKCTDEMTDNDIQDLTSIVSVIGGALTLDAVRKVNTGTIEIPAENGIERNDESLQRAC